MMNPNDVLVLEKEELLEALMDVVNQACGQSDYAGEEPDYWLDSGCLSSYADAIRLLEKHGKVTIEKQYGRAVVARWTL